MTFIIIYQNIIRADIQGLHTKIKKKTLKKLKILKNYGLYTTLKKKASKFQEKH